MTNQNKGWETGDPISPENIPRELADQIFGKPFMDHYLESRKKYKGRESEAKHITTVDSDTQVIITDQPENNRI